MMYVSYSLAALFAFFCTVLYSRNRLLKQSLDSISTKLNEVNSDLLDTRYSLEKRDGELGDLKKLLDEEKLSASNSKVRLEEAQARMEDLRISHEKSMNDLKTYHDKAMRDKEEERKDFIEKMELRFKEDMREMQDALQRQKEQNDKFLKDSFHKISGDVVQGTFLNFNKQQENTLKPLREWMDSIFNFKESIAKDFSESKKDRAVLANEIENLKKFSLQVSNDTNNLATVLKGENKRQGLWGEMVLERLLENSGLTKNREYFTQYSVKDSENNRLQPDVVIQLPENRCVIVDAKVSLTAYQRHLNSGSPDDLKDYIKSIEGHFKGLSVKSYQNLMEGQKLDFVIMFVPTESAYVEVMRDEMRMFLEAYQKQVIIASPSTLMVILRIINYIWQNDARDKNIQKILNECDGLASKFQSFKKSMERISDALSKAQDSFDKANSQLVTGKGSMASRVNKIHNLMSNSGIEATSDSEVVLVTDASEVVDE